MALWDKISARGNVDDRRSRAPLAIGGLSATGVILYLLVSFLAPEAEVTYDDISRALPKEGTGVVTNPEYEGLDDYELFVTQVMGSLDQLWYAKFEEMGETYRGASLVLFRTATESGCGYASSEVGPHYCPIDQTIYLDETFFNELRRKFGGSSGDVAQAYVIAHEVGHYVQDLLGVHERIQQIQSQNPGEVNTLSIAVELQADCYAGIWLNSIEELEVLQPGEIEEALSAAAAVGDDNIQEKATGRVNPENWNHGSSEQRVTWFTTGYQTGDINECNTFN